ncbi:MAG TPA: DUF5009 domain-containing protein [Patescibacteria group bacterium]|nr:DUF5009 domain-containing protein [Patescibacteria group bacterium]
MKKLVNTKEKTPTNQRIYSVDVLRGFLMLWGTVGLSLIFTKYAELTQSSFWLNINNSLSTHADWVGLHLYDLVFPGFIFVMGVVIPVVIDKRKDKGDKFWQIILSILKRTLLLILIGWFLNGVMRLEGWESFRILGVLQKIGITYFVVSILVLFLRTRYLAILAVLFFALYWWFLTFANTPGFGAGILTPEGNFIYYIDRIFLLPNQLLYKGLGDPEGILSTISTISLGLMGVLIGRLLQMKLKIETAGYIKAGILFLIGIILLSAAYIWAPYLPFIKKIWTSSYILASAGWMTFALSFLYLILDVWKIRFWAYPLAVVGFNPLFMYVTIAIIDFDGIARFFVGGLQPIYIAAFPLILAIAAFGVKWFILAYMYQKKIHIKI